LRRAEAIIVGASPAGPACAVTMRSAGFNATVLKKADGVGAAWRRHYDRLHLHTDRNRSGLPDMGCRRPIRPIRRARRWSSISKATPRASMSAPSSTRRCPASGATARSGVPMQMAAPSPRPWRSSQRVSLMWRLVPRGRVWNCIEVRRPQQRISQSSVVSAEARAGCRAWQFGRRDRARSGECRHRCRACGSKPRSDISPRTAGFPILAWAILYRRLPARGRSCQRADIAAGDRFLLRTLDWGARPRDRAG